MLDHQIHKSIQEIPAEQWDSCVGRDNPFASHAFLSALEESDCVHPNTGWMAQHITVWEDTHLKACAPLYLKSHSYGEYVFDWSWAQAYEQAGGRYYPKLLCAIPFSPVSGRRLLCHPSADEKHRQFLIEKMVEHSQQLHVSSLHVNFTLKQECELLQEHDMLARIGHQYHWSNDQLGSFDDFLSRLSSRKRKSIRKERRSVEESGIQIALLSGADITEDHWDSFFAFYMDTSGRKWGHPYLNRRFFSLLGQKMQDRVLLVLAEKNGRIVAGALNIVGDDTLFGRYWGCLEDYNFLHFECCYYQAIEYAIKHKLKRVEAGAQGQHKIQRGYLPVETYSAHWIASPSFKDAVSDFLVHDRQVNALEIAELSKFSPYKL